MKIAIIGTGNVGKSLGRALSNGNEVIYGSRNPSERKAPEGTRVTTIEDAVRDADVVFVAVPYTAVTSIVERIKDKSAGKILVDVTNALKDDGSWALGYSTSAAEELAKKVPEAKVVKAFNTVFAENMSTGKLGEERLTLFIAGNEKDAKETVKKLAEEIGFEVVDAGELDKARYLEAMGMLLMNLGYKQKMGNVGFRLVKG